VALALAAVFIVVGTEFAVLVVQSKALTEPALFGLRRQLKPVQNAIDRAIDANEELALVSARAVYRRDAEP